MYSSYMPYFTSQQPRSVAAGYRHDQSMYGESLIPRAGSRAQQLMKHPYHTPNTSSLPPIPPSTHCGNNSSLMYDFTAAAAAAAAAAATVNMASGNDMSYANLDIDRGVKRRRRLTQEETSLLNDIFERTSKPNALVRKMLAERLNMSPRTVQIWFQNRRAKVKKDGKSSGSVNGNDSSPSTNGNSPNPKCMSTSSSDSSLSLSRSTSTCSATVEAAYKLVSQDQDNLQDAFTPSLQTDGVSSISDWSTECDWAFQAMGYSSPGNMMYSQNKESSANPVSVSEDAESDTTATTSSSGQPWQLELPLGSCEGENYLGIHRLRASHGATDIKCKQSDMPFTPSISGGAASSNLPNTSADWFPDCSESNYLLDQNCMPLLFHSLQGMGEIHGTDDLFK